MKNSADLVFQQVSNIFSLIQSITWDTRANIPGAPGAPHSNPSTVPPHDVTPTTVACPLLS